MTTETTIEPPIPHSNNPLSTSPSGDSYTGLGCFPLGHHTTRPQYLSLLSTLRTLRTRSLLHPLSAANLTALKSSLVPLHTAQSFWSHHKRDSRPALAIAELLSLLSTDSPALKIYTFPDSERLSGGTQIFWGLSELCVEERVTYLYVSSKTSDVAGTVLHTFLSSRGVSRLQCFLAEYVLADEKGELGGEWGLPPRIEGDVRGLKGDEVRALIGGLEGEGKAGLEAPVLMAKVVGLCEEVVEGMERGRKEPIWWGEEEGEFKVV